MGPKRPTGSSQVGEPWNEGLRSSFDPCSQFDPWVGKILWRRERLPTPIFWPGEFHGLYSPWGCKELDMTEQLTSLHFTNDTEPFSQRLNFLSAFRKRRYEWKPLLTYVWKPLKHTSQGLVCRTASTKAAKCAAFDKRMCSQWVWAFIKHRQWAVTGSELFPRVPFA